MGVRSKMLAIAAWRLFFLIPTVVSQRPGGPGGEMVNPLVPANFSSLVRLTLTYRSGREHVQLCGRPVMIERSNRAFTIPNLPGSDPITVKASEVRAAPQVQFSGIPSTALYTYVVLNQGSSEPYGSMARPYIEELRVNVRGGDINTGVVVTQHEPVVLGEKGKTYISVHLYSQAGDLSNATLGDYVNKDCGFGQRCSFDLMSFGSDNYLDLVFAGGFYVQEDEFSLSILSMYWKELACKRAFGLRASRNPLIDQTEFYFGIKAAFKTEETMTEPLCARVFSYEEEEVHVLWNRTKAIPAHNVQIVPQVYLKPLKKDMGDKMDDDKAKNKTEKKDYWFTLVLVDQTVEFSNTAEEPFVNWVVSNIKNTDVSSGDCRVPYLPPEPSSGVGQATFLLYKQSKHVDIDPSEYAKDTPCPFQFRCNWNINRLVEDQNLTLVGVLPFHVASDPVSIQHYVDMKLIDNNEACRELAKFKREGRMLGQCLPKYDAWKALKKELYECVEEFQKKAIIAKMNKICPELGEHFAKEMKKWKEQAMKGGKDGQMAEYGKDKGKDMKMGMMGDMRKDEMEMFIKKFLMAAMTKLHKMKEQQSDGELMKPGDEIVGPHCVEVVAKYIMMMKKKMMKGKYDEKDDDEEDSMEEGGKCLEAAKMFMKEQWEKYQAKKKADDDWGNWRGWGNKNDDEDNAKWEKMMKEMWEKREEKKGEKDGEGKGDKTEKMMEMVKGMKEKLMKEFWENMKEGKEGENERGEKERGEGDDKMKKMMEMFKMKMMKEFFEKMMEGKDGKDGEEKGDKMEKMMEMVKGIKEKLMKEFWEKMKEGKDGEKERGEKERGEGDDKMKKMKMMKEFFEKMMEGKDGKDGEEKGDKMEKMMEMVKGMKEKLMKEFWEKMKEGKDGENERGEKERGEGDDKMKMMKEFFEKMMEGKDGKDGEEKGDKMEKMMEMVKGMKEKLMKEFWEKMKEGKDGENERGEKERGEGDDKMKKMMEMFKMKMMKEFFEKMMKGKDGENEWKEKWESWQNWDKEREGGDGGDKMKKMMEMFKMKMMKEFFEKMMKGKGGENEWKEKWESWQNWDKEREGGDGGDKMKKMMEMFKMKMMKEFFEKMMKGKDGENEWKEKWESWQNWDKEREGGDGGDEMKKMMEMFKMKMMKEIFEKMMKGKDGENDWKEKWESWQNWDKEREGGEGGDKMKKMQMMKEFFEKMMKEKMMNEWKEKWESWKSGDKNKDGGEKGDKMEKMMGIIKMIKEKMMKEFAAKMKERSDKMEKGEDEGEKLKKIMDSMKAKMVKEFWAKLSGGGEKDQWGMKMEEMKMKMMNAFMEKMKESKEGEEEGEKGEKVKNMMEMIKMKMMKEMFEKMMEKKKKEKWEMIMQEIKKKMMAEQNKDKWGKFMEEMRKKWEEHSDKLSEEEEKEKKMAFLVHAFKAFLAKHMEMKEKLEHVQEFFKKKMALEKMCSEEELKKEDSKCGMLFHKLMVKKKMMEMLHEQFTNMKEKEAKEQKEKHELVKKMVSGLMMKDEM